MFNHMINKNAKIEYYIYWFGTVCVWNAKFMAIQMHVGYTDKSSIQTYPLKVIFPDNVFNWS